MDTGDITASFGPARGDRKTLSKSCRSTLDMIYQHPISHNLEWASVMTLFGTLGSVEHKPNNEFAFAIGDDHRLMHKTHGKDLSTDDVIAVRHMLTHAGWAPTNPASAPHAEAGGPANAIARPDLLVCLDHREARIYQLEIAAADAADHVISPYDPHHFLHHLSHKDRSRERGQRVTEDPTFYEQIAGALRAAGRIIVAGHGHGHSNAAHHLGEYLQQHHRDIAQMLTVEVDVDLSSLTPPQLLALARRSLTTNPAL